MAKPTSAPPASNQAEIHEAIILLADVILSDYFFDPDNEDVYKQRHSTNRPAGSAALLLEEETLELEDAECTLRIEALRSLTHFRITVVHPSFTAAVEGRWSFDNEELDGAKVTKLTGNLDNIEALVEEIIQEIEGSALDDDVLADVMEAIGDDEEVPLIGDDPTEPLEATALDRNRIKAIAKRIARNLEAEINIEDRSWLEQTPQTLPVITESLIAAASAPKRDEPLVMAYQVLLGLQLEFVRYRQDRGWDWANDMLTAFQQRLVAVGRAETVPRDDWFMMCSALTEARVPVSSEVQTQLADAGFKPDEEAGPPEQMMQTLRGFMDQLADMVSTPYEVITALQSAGAMLPPALRGFMATELALSPHQVLRDAVPVMLLDDDPMVRESAAGALEQTARPDTLSPDTLRRAIALRNWIPATHRASLDTAIRKARLAGVETGAWPAPTRDLEFYASTIDGSGAQSILVVSRFGKKGLFAGLLLRHGTGVVDSWIDPEISRGKISKLLREAQMAAPSARVEKTFVDVMVQHAIGTSVEHGAVPPAALLEMAEIVGGAEWKDRRLDIEAEANAMFEALDPADRTPQGIEAGFAHGLDWMSQDEVFGSWFEDGPNVHKALAKLPRTDQSGMAAVVMADILPQKRSEWAERFLVMAMWAQAAADAKYRAKARDLVLIAHALAGDSPLEAIPIMTVIAMQTVRATLLGGW